MEQPRIALETVELGRPVNACPGGHHRLEELGPQCHIYKTTAFQWLRLPGTP